MQKILKTIIPAKIKENQIFKMSISSSFKRSQILFQFSIIWIKLYFKNQTKSKQYNFNL